MKARKSKLGKKLTRAEYRKIVKKAREKREREKFHSAYDLSNET